MPAKGTGDANRLGAKSLEERTLEIPTTTNIPLHPYVSTSTRLPRTSRAPELLRQTPTRPYTRSTPPVLHASMSLRLQRISRAPYLHVPTLAAHPQNPGALEANSYTYLHRRQTSRAPYLYASTSARLQRTSRAPDLLRQTPPRPYACRISGSIVSRNCHITAGRNSQSKSQILAGKFWLLRYKIYET